MAALESWSEALKSGFSDLAHRAKGNVASLDALRTLAILFVFSGHYAGEFQAKPKVVHFPLFYFGWTGVDLFFVLSGFLIGSQLWKQLKASGGIKIGTFILRRGLRIWPLYFSFVAFVALKDLYLHIPVQVWADLFCVSNYFHHQVGGGWSLSSEEQFYLIAPTLILLFVAVRVKPRQMWLLPVAWLAVVVSIRAFLVSQGTPDSSLSLYAPLSTHSEGLALGLLFAWFAIFEPQRFRSTRFRVLSSVGMLAVAVGIYAADRVVFKFLSLALIFGSLVLLTYSESIQHFFKWHGFYVVSRLSYGIYLNHFEFLPVAWPFFGKVRQSFGEPGFWLCYLLCFTISLAISFVTFQLIEWPFLALRARLLHRQRNREFAPAPSTSAAL
ncbi:MAG TPA: acyltransferase [Bryobacteraceae bacterium]|nr:acyltransferase [Bryobacteraceae bacterium]